MIISSPFGDRAAEGFGNKRLGFRWDGRGKFHGIPLAFHLDEVLGVIVMSLEIFIRHGTFARSGNELGIFGEHAARVTRRGLDPGGHARGDFLVG